MCEWLVHILWIPGSQRTINICKKRHVLKRIRGTKSFPPRAAAVYFPTRRCGLDCGSGTALKVDSRQEVRHIWYLPFFDLDIDAGGLSIPTQTWLRSDGTRHSNHLISHQAQVQLFSRCPEDFNSLTRWIEVLSPNSGSHVFLPYLFFSVPSLVSDLDLLPSSSSSSFYHKHPSIHILLHMFS